MSSRTDTPLSRWSPKEASHAQWLAHLSKAHWLWISTINMFFFYVCWPVSWSTSQQPLNGLPWDLCRQSWSPNTEAHRLLISWHFIICHQNIKASLPVHQLTDMPVGVTWAVIIPDINLIPPKLCNLKCTRRFPWEHSTRAVVFHNGSRRTNVCTLAVIMPPPSPPPTASPTSPLLSTQGQALFKPTESNRQNPSVSKDTDAKPGVCLSWCVLPLTLL